MYKVTVKIEYAEATINAKTDEEMLEAIKVLTKLQGNEVEVKVTGEREKAEGEGLKLECLNWNKTEKQNN